MVGEKYTYFLVHYYKFIESGRIKDGILLNSTNMSPYDYHVEKCGEKSFKN